MAIESSTLTKSEDKRSLIESGMGGAMRLEGRNIPVMGVQQNIRSLLVGDLISTGGFHSVSRKLLCDDMVHWRHEERNCRPIAPLKHMEESRDNNGPVD
ncbi:hypothetical protein TNCV_3313141 [Trichonephila clavipes]|nr:hypothetical protein TNCV_3313141 [Trichonephila clavipes]